MQVCTTPAERSPRSPPGSPSGRRRRRSGRRKRRGGAGRSGRPARTWGSPRRLGVTRRRGRAEGAAGGRDSGRREVRGGCAEFSDAPPSSTAGCWLLEGQRLARRTTCASRRHSTTCSDSQARRSVTSASAPRRSWCRCVCGAGAGCAPAAARPDGGWRSTTAASNAGGISTSAPAAASLSPNCGGCAAATVAPCAWSRCHGRGRVPRTRATSRTSSRGWRSRWPRRRSPGCCGSRGTPSGGSSNASSSTGSTSAASMASSRSAWTRSPTAAGSAT